MGNKKKKEGNGFVASCLTSEIVASLGPQPQKKRRGGLKGLGVEMSRGGLKFQVGGPKKLILRQNEV